MGFTSLIEKIRDYWKHRGKRPNTYKIDKIYVLKNLVSPSAGGDNEDTLTTKAIKPLEFTGERFLPGEQGRIRLEHMHRYAVVQGLVQDRVILDIACGEGYGSALLAKSAQSVVGVDIAQEAIDHAQELYRASNLKFVQGSATQLEFADASFDVVVSFETIEHLAEQEQMLKELSRVLRSDGILIISSPNRPIYSEESGELNEFHVKELDFQEFDDLLGQQFKSIRYYGQRIQMGSMINSIAEARSSLVAWSDSGQEISQNIPPVKEPIYFVAVCSKTKSVTLPNIEASVMYPEAIDLVKHYISFATWAKNQDDEIRVLRLLVSDTNNLKESSIELQRNLDSTKQELDTTKQELDSTKQELDSTKQELGSTKQELGSIKQELGSTKQELGSTKQELGATKQELGATKQELGSTKQELGPSKQEVKIQAQQFLELKKILLDSQRYMVESHSIVSDLNQIIQNKNISIMQRVKRKLRVILHRKISPVGSESAYSLQNCPWLVLFDAPWYLEQNQDVKLSGVNPLQHYWEFGAKEGRNPNAFFDTLWYLDENLDVRTLGLNPLQHYWEFGGIEGRNPSPRFNSGQYYLLNPDVKQSNMNPLEHYLLYGKKEGRLISNPIHQGLANDQLFKDEIAQHLAPYHFFYESIAKNEVYLEQALSEIRFKKSESPVVSVIIPIYGKWEYTLQCLYSLYLNLPTEFTLEIIVVDDCSPDQSGDIISKVEGIHYVRNPINLGFLKSCNYGASLAKGKFLYFLNNDTVIRPGCIEELLATFNKFPLAGLVGSKLIYPDGSLQEAGGIIWQDASGWNFGRNQDPCAPIYNYAREVDYCSGASIMIARELFFSLSEFEERYVPAYYEDVDLAFKVKEAGLKVLYQPLSQVIHFEGVSSGTDLTVGVKSYQVTNQKKFLERWRAVLHQHQENAQDVEKAKDRGTTYRILFIDATVLTPNADAGSLLIFNKMILFRELGFQVTFAHDGNLHYSSKDIEELQRIGIEVLYAPYVQKLKDHLEVCEDRYDLVMLIRPNVFKNNIWDIKKYCPSAKIFFHTIDLHFLRMQRQAEITQDKEMMNAVNAMREREISYIKIADLTFIVSSEEMNLLKEIDKNLKLQEFSLILDINPSEKPFSQRKDILFIGNFNHPPNRDAVYFFCTEVMPHIRKANQEISFRIGGSNMPEEIKKLATGDIVIEGFIPDLNEKCDEVRIMVAPLRFGAGVKGKIASSLACGLPVVATKVASEGMYLENDLNIVIADDPQEIANAILKLYNDEEVWQNLSQNGLIAANKLWGFSGSLQKLKKEVLEPYGLTLAKKMLS